MGILDGGVVRGEGFLEGSGVGGFEDDGGEERVGGGWKLKM